MNLVSPALLLIGALTAPPGHPVADTTTVTVSGPPRWGSEVRVVEVASAVRAALQVPDYVPPATDLHVGADGWLWVKREDGASGASVWDVFDDEGQLTGVLQLDSTARGLDSAGPYLWYFTRQGDMHTLFRARNPWK